MRNILAAEAIDESMTALPDTEWHVACSSTNVLTPQEADGSFRAFPVLGFMRHEPGGGCIAHSHPGPQCFYITEGQALFQVGKEESLVGAGTLIFVPPDVPHQYKTVGETHFTCMVMEASLEGLQHHTNYPTISYPEILEKTLGAGKVDREKIRRELGWEVDAVE